MERTVVIDYLPTSPDRYKHDHAVIAIDVIRATTTAITALSLGREVYPARGTDDAVILGRSLRDPLFVGELGGNVPYGFHLTNSPVQVAALTQVPSGSFTRDRRPLILVSSSGTPLILNATGAEAVYIACARNYSAVADYVAGRHRRIAILGAGTRGEFRREDQLICAWIADTLTKLGYRTENQRTDEIIARWQDAEFQHIRSGGSAEYLRRSGQVHDLEFILHHIDDLDIVPVLENGKLTIVSKIMAQAS